MPLRTMRRIGTNHLTYRGAENRTLTIRTQTVGAAITLHPVYAIITKALTRIELVSIALQASRYPSASSATQTSIQKRTGMSSYGKEE